MQSEFRVLSLSIQPGRKDPEITHKSLNFDLTLSLSNLWQITANELSQYFNLHCTVHLHEQLHACDHMCVSAAWGISLGVCPPVISLVSGPVVYSLRPLAY